MRGSQRYGRQNNNNRRGNFRNQNYNRNSSGSYGHMKDRIETKGMIEPLVTVEQNQVQGQLQIGTELDALNVENTTTSQGNV